MSIDILGKNNIIYKDQDFLVLEKPSGILVQPTKYQEEDTLVDWLIKEFPSIQGAGDSDRPGIVHRLDMDVSGLMVIALNQKMYDYLVEQFKSGKVNKEYSALVVGNVKNQSGEIDLPIGRTKKGKLVAVQSEKKIKFSKQAFTEYQVIKRFQDFTLLKVKIWTGRTHQIRLHLKSIGRPIIGDFVHSKKQKENKLIQELTRPFLHASYLGFNDLKANFREFKSDLPKELKTFLNRIK